MSNPVLDRFARVKALQKPLNAATPRSSSEAKTPALSEKAKSSAAEPRGFLPHLPEGAEHRLAADLVGGQEAGELAREVLVEGLLRDTGSRGDVGHRRGAVALLGNGDSYAMDQPLML